MLRSPPFQPGRFQPSAVSKFGLAKHLDGSIFRFMPLHYLPSPCNSQTHLSWSLCPLIHKDPIRLPSAAVRHPCGTFYTPRHQTSDLCWTTQKIAVNQLQRSHNPIVCLTNTILRMRHRHSAIRPISQIARLAAERPLNRPVRGHFSCHPIFDTTVLAFLLV